MNILMYMVGLLLTFLGGVSLGKMQVEDDDKKYAIIAIILIYLGGFIIGSFN